jgi:hypothetical protein
MSYRRLGRDNRFTPAGRNLELLPSSQMGDTFGPKGMEYAIATLPGVRDELNAIAARAYAGAQARLAQVRAKLGELGKKMERGVVVTLQEAKKGRFVDAYLYLDDHFSSTPNAIAIEMGRSAYEYTDKNGNTYEIGGMEGVGILHAGFGMRPGDLSGTGGGDI